MITWSFLLRGAYEFLYFNWEVYALFVIVAIFWMLQICVWKIIWKFIVFSFVCLFVLMNINQYALLHTQIYVTPTVLPNEFIWWNIHSRGAILACALPWLRSLLLQHASGIVSQESSLSALNSLYQVFNCYPGIYYLISDLIANLWMKSKIKLFITYSIDSHHEKNLEYHIYLPSQVDLLVRISHFCNRRLQSGLSCILPDWNSLY